MDACCAQFSSGGGYSSTEVKAAPKLNKKSASITVGKTVKLSVKGTKKKVKWSSSNSAVASVSKKGLVKGISAGKATIKAKAGSKTLKCSIKVKAKENKTPTGLKITSPWKFAYKGCKFQMSLEYAPANAEQKAVKWYSSDTRKAAVSDTGLVTVGESSGDVTITAELADNSQVKDSFTFTVKDWALMFYTPKAKDGGDVLLSDNNAAAVFKCQMTSYAVPDMQVQVEDSVGTVIRTIPAGAFGLEEWKDVEWDLKDAAGNKVRAGIYFFKLVMAESVLDFNTSFRLYAASDFGDANNGSEARPYTVSTFAQLKDLVGRHNDRHFKQTADIDANYQEITPLFSEDDPFTGTYDGGNFTIKNIVDALELSNVGIFRKVGKDGVLKNMVVEKSSFTGQADVAAFAGMNEGTIQDCTVKESTFKATDGRSGAIASNNSGVIRGCKVFDSSISTTNSNAGAGAVSGYSKGTIAECQTERTNISVTQAYNFLRAGGIVGINDGNVTACTVKTAEISCDKGWYAYGGGIAGHNTGNVTGNTVDADLALTGFRYGSGGIIGSQGGTESNNTYGGALYKVGAPAHTGAILPDVGRD